MYCPKCYRLNDDNSQFCSACGHPLADGGDKSSNNAAPAFCIGCGTELKKGSVFCPKCGKSTQTMRQDDYGNNREDKPSTPLNVLSFLCPILGLILFCVMYNRTPKKAISIGKAALLSVALCIIAAIAMGIYGYVSYADFVSRAANLTP